MKKSWLFSVLVLFMLPSAAQAITIERIAAVAGDDVITLQDLREEGGLRYAVKGKDIRDIDDAADKTEQLEALTKELVQTRLISRQARKNDIHIGDREVDMQLAEMYRRSGQNEAAFKAMMADSGIDWNAYRRYMRGELEAQYVIRSELAGQVTPSEADVVACAQENSPGAERGVSVSLSQIIIPEIKADSQAGLNAPIASQLNATWWNTLDDVVALYADGVQEVTAKDPDRFVEFVHKYSSGRSVERDGVLGTFAPGDLSTDFSVAFTLQKGDISPVISTAAGYHVLRIDDVIEGESEAWKKAKDTCREQISMKESQRLIESWLNDLMEKNYVSITVNQDIRTDR